MLVAPAGGGSRNSNIVRIALSQCSADCRAQAGHSFPMIGLHPTSHTATLVSGPPPVQSQRSGRGNRGDESPGRQGTVDLNDPQRQIDKEPFSSH